MKFLLIFLFSGTARKRAIFLLCVSLLCITGFSQPRKTINFNQGWEMINIPATEQLKIDLTVRNKADFESQFNQEHITGQSNSVDSAVIKELSVALNGFETEYPGLLKQKWEKVSLPHPARYEQELNPAALQYIGITYYRKQFTVPDPAQQVSIKFEGVMQQASVWVNGRFVMQNQGGYLPFVVPVNPYMKAGNNEIIVRVDNRDNPNTPPGKPLTKNGFLYWSGIYRDVKMVITPDVFITDPVTTNKVASGGVFVRYQNVSDCSAEVLIQTHLKNGSGQNQALTVKQNLFDASGKLVNSTGDNPAVAVSSGKDAEVKQTMKVDNPHLWSPDEPYLYLLTTEILKNGQVVDQLSQKIGIRHLSFTRWEGFKLNGKPVKIVGTNRHEDHPYIGNSLSAAEQYRDLKRIKNTGMNFVRLGHYCNSPDVYNICDSIGLMVIDPIPGWQFFNRSEIFKQRVFRDIRQMVRRDRNHPCVVLWEASLNESYPPDAFRIQSALIAHEEYPGDQCFTSGDCYGSKTTAWDVPYNDWKGFLKRPQDVQKDRPGLVREYGDFEFGGFESTTRVNRSHGEKALLINAWNVIWEHNLLRGPEYTPWTIGDANWAFYDGFEAYTKGTTDWGIMDIFRIPKFAYYFFQSQQTPYSVSLGKEIQPMVYLANWWTERPKDKVVVFSNCDEVELFVNGKSIRKQRPDSGLNSEYGQYDKGGNPFDGGNCQYLDRPPFTFMNVDWEAGELKAVGYINGKKVTEDLVRTPEKAVGLKLEMDDMGMPLQADGSDVVFVHAYIVDKNGTTVCTDNETKVKFEVKGEGVLVCPSEAQVRGGIASIVVRSTTTKGKITVTGISGKQKSKVEF